MGIEMNTRIWNAKCTTMKKWKKKKSYEILQNKRKKKPRNCEWD